MSDCEAQLHFYTHKMPQLLARLSAIVIFFIIIIIFSVPSLCPVYGVPVHTLSLRSFYFLLFFFSSLIFCFILAQFQLGPNLLPPTDYLYFCRKI